MRVQDTLNPQPAAAAHRQTSGQKVVVPAPGVLRSRRKRGVCSGRTRYANHNSGAPWTIGFDLKAGQKISSQLKAGHPARRPSTGWQKPRGFAQRTVDGTVDASARTFPLKFQDASAYAIKPSKPDGLSKTCLQNNFPDRQRDGL